MKDNVACSSYKEASDCTDSDDLITMDEADIEKLDAKNDAETVEKVLLSRVGRAEATGHKTTKYNVLDQGDPNEGFDPNFDKPERQYFIKWKNWAHIHNTWESMESLKEQKANGIKKVENQAKRDKEIEDW